MKSCSSTRYGMIQCSEHCPRRAYLELKVPMDAQVVTVASFTTVSRDQGWADNKSASYTWFEVALRRPEARSNLGSIRIQHNRVAEAEFFEATTMWNIQQPELQSAAWLRSLRPRDVIQIIPKAVYPGWVNIIREASIRIEYQPFADTFRRSDAPQPLTAPMQSNYYGPLRRDSQQIRVLIIKPGEFCDPIEAHFEHIELGKPSDDQRNFDALSYCWGDSPEKVDICFETETTGKGSFRISVALERAIQHLRHKDAPLRIWIDAVCINQESFEERSQQVSMMGTIYSRATKVHIWLGEGHPGLEAALRVIRDIYNLHHHCCPGGDKCGCSGTKHRFRIEELESATQKDGWLSFGSLWEVFNLHYHTKPLDPYLVEASGGEGHGHFSYLMQNLFQNPWFQRVWVVQEALLSQEAFVHYGKETIGWEELLMVNGLLEAPHYRGQAPNLRGQLTMPPIWNKLFPVLMNASKRRSQTILEVFLTAIDMKATDRRDKLFALLSFGKETSVAIPPALLPDYTKSPDQVMANFTRWWIKEYHSLDILSLIHCQPRRAWQRTLSDKDTRIFEPISHPTWTIGTEGYSTWSRMTLIEQFPFFQASGNTVPDEQLLDRNPQDPLTLILRGHIIGELVALGYPQKSAVYPDPRGSARQPADIPTVLHRMLDPCSHTGVWSHPGTRKDHDGTVNPTEWRWAFNDHVAAHTEYFPAPVQQILRPIEGGGYEPCLREGELPTCIERCFFVASNGLYGLCPWTARKGDIISVFHGGKVPLLIRPSSQGSYDIGLDVPRYELVGECFVDSDVMSGVKSEGGIANTEIFALV
ncbi:putative heterokaryon incompatibility protein [Cladorrhinum sp. PSN259]|nr:putative heterokaryon incompatibility protein [Cladorrhinum sp. PSN259]